MYLLMGSDADPKTVERLNRLRKYLRIVHSSELVHADGQTLKEEIFSSTNSHLNIQHGEAAAS